MANDFWMTLTTQISASGLTAALLYLDARLTLQANGASVLAANCLQACGKGRRGDFTLLLRAAMAQARSGMPSPIGVLPPLVPLAVYRVNQLTIRPDTGK